VKPTFRSLALIAFLGSSLSSDIGVLRQSRAERLAGATDASPRWGSGWLDLSAPTDLKKGERLRIVVGGTATLVLVRLLRKVDDSNGTGGLVSGAVPVPENRTVEITLPSDLAGVIQVSVHGGPNPWGRFRLGVGNGPASLESVDRMIGR
jgi:hypothetical protein